MLFHFIVFSQQQASFSESSAEKIHFLSNAKCLSSPSWAFAHTYFTTCTLIIEGAESDGGKEDGDVQEDGCGHVLQQGFITANNTWGEYKQKHMSHSRLIMEQRRLNILILEWQKHEEGASSDASATWNIQYVHWLTDT